MGEGPPSAALLRRHPGLVYTFQGIGTIALPLNKREANPSITCNATLWVFKETADEIRDLSPSTVISATTLLDTWQRWLSR